MSYATDTVVVRLSEYEALKMMDAETQREAAMALLEQAFTGVQQTSHNVMVQMLLRMSYDNQIATLERYHSAVRSGSAGGRPETIPAKQVQELTEKGLTQEQIAEKLKCSVSTVQKKQRQLGITRNNQQKPVITPVNTGVITSENLDTDTDIDKATDYATDGDGDKNKNTDKNKTTATATDGDTAVDGDADRATHSHAWKDERQANDHPYVGKAYDQGAHDDDDDGLPF